MSSLSGGIVIPKILVEKEFKKENQTKTIQYINLEKYHSKNQPTEESKRKLYDKNKNVFFTEFKTIRFAEVTPEKISGNKDYDENFFKQLDKIENNVLDGLSFDEAVEQNNLKAVTIKNINAKKEDDKKNKFKDISDKLFQKIYNIKITQSAEIFNIEEKYYLAEVLNVQKKDRKFDDPEVQEALNAQLSFKNKIENNTSIIKDISMGALNKEKFKEFASENKLEIKNYQIKNIKQNEIFSEGIIKRIFLTKDGEIDLITNSTLTKSFLVLGIKTNYRELGKDSNEYEQYEAKARLNLINKI